MNFDIPTPDGPYTIQLDAGSTTTFCGSNGSGKTRLAVEIESNLGLRAHRISAHRALPLNPEVSKIPEKQALAGLRTGDTQELNLSDMLTLRSMARWQSNPATQLLNDFDPLIQALFADHAKTTHESHKRLRAGSHDDVNLTKFEQLFRIWDELLPDRTVDFDGDSINVRIPGSGAAYSASEMSDGERAVFYLIGQTLVAEKDSILIIDEPELHLHPSIMTALWDQIAVTRPDCAFVFITHSLQFAAGRPGSKFVIREYDPAPTWELEIVDEDTGFSEELSTLLLGSRRPVLFVEGGDSSLDRVIFQSAYPNYLVVPCGSCEAVIHSVKSMRKNTKFTRVDCRGIVDRDHRSDEEINHLQDLGVEVLSVAEIENIVLLPEVSRAIAICEGYKDEELDSCLDGLRQAVFERMTVSGKKEEVVAGYTLRQIDRILKNIDLKGDTSIQGIGRRFKEQTETLDISALASKFDETLQSAVDANDLRAFLEHWDDKGLFPLAALELKKCSLKSFKEWLERVLGNGSEPELSNAIRECLPEIPS